ncbi:hypothetical protein BpHYR1_026339 [Brachionus plicatilis]|uniref:Uncharacterized protein n=1 Tax=Brachionus plicatilis TaxID=10195 RepID=A0A3M7TAY0_BRAPC|nr:hypothetical protein BpHYR1_026339 [Brachionus plicatilis]
MSAQSNSLENLIPEYFKDFIWTDDLIKQFVNINVEFSDLYKLILNTTDSSEIFKPISSSLSVTQSIGHIPSLKTEQKSKMM